MKLKVCGMAAPDNITAVASVKPQYLGFIFYNKTPRFFNGTIPKISKHIQKVGVFVNASIANVAYTVNHHKLDLVQLHGNETSQYCEHLIKYCEEQLETIPQIIKVFSVKDYFNFKHLNPYEGVCDFFLFDTKGENPGGNGTTFNWQVLENYPSNKPYFLSGGIGLEALDQLNAFLDSEAATFCHAIDVNSKFEIAPGLKDINLIKLFKQNLSVHT